MPFKLNGKSGCTLNYNSKEICVAYFNGVKVFGCRTSATVSDNSGILDSKTFTFSEASFTKNFTTDSPYTYNNVYLRSLTTVQLLKLIGVNAKVGNSFKAINSSGLKFQLGDQYAIYGGVLYEFPKSIDSIIVQYDDLGYKLTGNANGRLTFTSLEDSTDVVTVIGTKIDNSKLTFDFQVSDSSEQQILTNTAKFSLIPQGDVNIKPVYFNNPPTVGDNTLTTNYNKSITFTKANFVDETHPIYSDPEGDAPWRLLVATLPQYGTLTLAGIAVVAGQVLTFEDIAAGKFVYTPDSTRTDIKTDPFKFSVADTGSKEFAQWQ